MRRMMPQAKAFPISRKTVYGPPTIRQAGEGFNDGGVHIGISLRYATDYVFRGIEPVEPTSSEDAINGQVDSRLTFDLGRLPDPYIGVFVNTAEGDEISNFQIIRPIAGLRWELEAAIIDLGHQSFTYPDRDELDSNEVFLDVHFNDAALVGEEGPLLGPYVFAAYDYDAFEGTYIEAGFRRESAIAESSLRLGYNVHVAYVDSLGDLYGSGPNPGGSGFQHYQLGLTARYDLNTLLNLSRRYGEWSLEGFINYTDGIDNDLRANTQIWGGGGIVFRY